jgi:hypothetical protein
MERADLSMVISQTQVVSWFRDKGEMNLAPCCERDIENGFHEALGMGSETPAEFFM